MQDLTTGSVTRHLLATTSFMLVTMVFQTAYMLIDLYWVGRLGKEAVAAVGLGGNLTFIVLAVSQMLGVGTTTLVAHAVGRSDRDRALLIFNQSQVLSLLVAVLFFVIGMALRMTYARSLSADDRTATLAGEFLFWFIPAMSLQYGLIAMGAALRGTGNFKPGMVVQTTTVIMNMLMAPFLIFGWVTGRPFGVAGAAMSTLISIALGSVWLVTYFVPDAAYLRFTTADWRPRIGLWWEMLKIGLPAGAEFLLMAVYLFIIYAVARRFGSAAQAGFGIGIRVVQAGFMAVVALGFAVAPVAAQNFGARHAQRVRDTFRSAAAMATGAMLAFTVLCQVEGAWMIRLFSSDPQVIAVGDKYLEIVSWSFVGSGIVFVAASMFQAMGNTVPSLIASAVRIGLVAVPLLWMSRMPGFELQWVWYLSVAALTVQVVLQLAFLRREYGRRLDFALVEQG